MKKNIRQWTVVLLVCVITALQPAGVYAEENSQTEGVLMESTSDNPEKNSDASQNEGQEDDDNSQLEGDAGEPEAENESTPKEIGSQEKEEDSSSFKGSEAENDTAESGEAQDAVDASGQKGEVTEPITKEDKPYLALGANLTPEQKNTVLSLLGINAAELEEYDVIYITNDEEHQYLGEYVAADKIGTRSLSSVLVVKREKGNGINITTKNISYCTIGMYKNALITAGITDADIIVAGPAPISGTAALVGVMKAYSDMTGEKVTEQSMDTALNELVLTGDLADTVGDSEKAEELIAYLKQEVIEKNLSSESEIREVIGKACDEFSIQLSENEIAQLVELLQKIESLDLDLDSIKDQAQELYDKLSQIDTGGFFDRVAGFFRSIIDFFKGLFS